LAAETIARVVIRGPSNSIKQAQNFLVLTARGRVDAHMVSIFAQRVLPLAVLAVATVSVPFLMLSPSGLPRLRNLEEERRKANEEISRLGSQIAGLRAEVQRIKSDPAAVERAARDELGLVRTTEVVFQFSE
jgi:cell division protein FtsB